MLGRFGGVSTGFELRTEDAYEIGLFAFELQMFPEALEWLEFVFSRMKENIGNGLITADAVLGLIMEVSKAVRSRNTFFRANEGFKHNIPIVKLF
jgi:hypothetical protein